MSDLDIPDFLKRPPTTDEQRAKLRRLTAKYTERKIKNPPKRCRKHGTGLGGTFGQKIRSF